MADLQNREDIIKVISSLFIERKEIVLAYLFGSQAKGVNRTHSDIDVAILLDAGISVEESPYGYKSAILTELMMILHTNSIDLVILNDASPFLRFQVVRYGIPVLVRSEAERIDFHVKTISRYNDVKVLLKTQYKYISERLKDGTYGRR